MVNHKLKDASFALMKVLSFLMWLQLSTSTTAFQQNVRPLSLSPKSRSIDIPMISLPIYPCKIRPLIVSSHFGNRSEMASSRSVLAEVDTAAIAKYFIALGTQVSLFGLTFYTIDSLLHSSLQMNARMIPKPILWIIFYGISLKSRIFNPLNNSRPKLSQPVLTMTNTTTVKGFNDRIMPRWTPPGFIFPIVWLLLISPLRATASILIIQAKCTFFSLPLMSWILHLSIGDIWNTINNTERRYGTSVLGVAAVWVSAVHASYQYYRLSPMAGRLLGGTCIWLSIAAALIIQTWRLNPSSIQGWKRDPFLPMVTHGEKSRTQFTW